MAYRYSAHSLREQETLHAILSGLFTYVLETHDHRIETGLRQRQDQRAAFATGNSKVSGEEDYPHMPRTMAGEPWDDYDDETGVSWAVDVTPYVDGQPLDAEVFGRDPWVTARWAYFAGVVMGEANNYLRAHENQTGEKFRIRWGGNWDRDAEILDSSDRRFVDAYHWELERVE